jgi:hypothetical protein
MTLGYDHWMPHVFLEKKIKNLKIDLLKKNKS